MAFMVRLSWVQKAIYYRVSDNDFGKARGRNPSKAYREYVVEDSDR